MNKPRYTYLSYNQIAMKIDTLVPSIREEGYSALVVIVRGGSFPGTHLSIRTGLPIYYLVYHKKKKVPYVSWIGEPAPQGKILLVEDMAGAGKTLTSCQDFLLQSNYEVETFVIFQDSLSRTKPDFCCFTSEIPGETFLLPWEKTKLNPTYDTMDKRERFVDHELEFTVWNLNCFIEQIEVNGFVKRSITPKSLIEEQDVLLGEDRHYELDYQELIRKEKIENRLYLFGVNEEALQKEKSALGQALALGSELLVMGCSRYVENDVERLVLLNSCFPHLEVLWWNNGNPIALTTASVS